MKIVLGLTELVAGELTAAQSLLFLPNLAPAWWRSIF
jgi:hypothetical protein